MVISTQLTKYPQRYGVIIYSSEYWHNYYFIVFRKNRTILMFVSDEMQGHKYCGGRKGYGSQRKWHYLEVWHYWSWCGLIGGIISLRGASFEGSYMLKSCPVHFLLPAQDHRSLSYHLSSMSTCMLLCPTMMIRYWTSEL